MKNYSIITLKKPNITDFSLERNSLLRKAKTDWVFFVDSDEDVSPKLKEEISEWLNGQIANNYNGFYVYRKNYFLGKYVGTDKILRLGRKDAGKWKRRVHEIWKINGKVGQLTNPLIHQTTTDLHGFIDKINLYSTLHAEENFDHGKMSNSLKIVFYPIFKFFQSMLIGRGFVMSMLQSFHSFLAWSKEWTLQKN